MIEMWKSIEGFDGYQISSQGRVFSAAKRGMLKPCEDSTIKSVTVCMTRNGCPTRRQIALMVAKAFIPNTFSSVRVGFCDGNWKNVSVSNLYWKYPSSHVNKLQKKNEKKLINILKSY